MTILNACQKMDNTLVLATQNPGKIAEFERLLNPISKRIVALSDFTDKQPAETGSTFVENALIKAKFAASVSGLPALADDSGLVVRALGGAPGIYSARYAGEHAASGDHIAKLCAALSAVTDRDRQAYFYCCLVLVSHPEDPTPIIAEGHWEGRILREPLGQNGFGYDPIFWDEKSQCTAAQLSPVQKNQVSHRAKACRVLLDKLRCL